MDQEPPFDRLRRIQEKGERLAKTGDPDGDDFLWLIAQLQARFEVRRVSASGEEWIRADRPDHDEARKP